MEEIDFCGEVGTFGRRIHGFGTVGAAGAGGDQSLQELAVQAPRRVLI